MYVVGLSLLSMDDAIVMHRPFQYSAATLSLSVRAWVLVMGGHARVCLLDCGFNACWSAGNVRECEYGGTGRGAACGDLGHCPLRMYAPANELIRLNPV